MASVRGKIRARTERRYARLPLDWAVEDLNRVLRGWGNYFRYGNSADKFNHIDAYVNERLAILASAKHGLQGRNWRDRFNYEWSTQLGIYRLGGTVKPTLAYASRWTMSESRVRENRTHGSMRRREATPDQSAQAARSPEASRRPYKARVGGAGGGLLPSPTLESSTACVLAIAFVVLLPGGAPSQWRPSDRADRRRVTTPSRQSDRPELAINPS
jgi:hypothetical protein